MDRRAFLKAVATVALAATLPPVQAHREQYLTYRGAKYFFDPYCERNRMYVIDPSRWFVMRISG